MQKCNFFFKEKETQNKNLKQWMRTNLVERPPGILGKTDRKSAKGWAGRGKSWILIDSLNLCNNGGQHKAPQMSLSIISSSISQESWRAKWVERVKHACSRLSEAFEGQHEGHILHFLKKQVYKALQGLFCLSTQMVITLWLS